MTQRYRIELASSADAAPLFASLTGTRLVWTPHRDVAVSFRSVAAAWDFAFACELPVVRVR